MRKLLIAFNLLLATITICAQNDSIIGGILPMTDDEMELLYSTPYLELSEASQRITLPVKVDNSKRPYFRDIFNQSGNSCVFAAIVGYVFTYEINRARNIEFDINDSTTFYPTHFGYNLHNNGQDNGTTPHSAFQLLKYTGTPNAKDWGGMSGDITRMMTGYNKWERAIGNRVKQNYKIDIRTPDGLELLKHWLHNHNSGDSTGGVATFVTFMNDYQHKARLPEESDDENSWIITDMTVHTGGHMMTIVGYNDSVMYDFDGNGEFTNEGEDMSQWEIGALKVANSAGRNWLGEGESNDGFIYWPYRLIGQTENGDYPIDTNIKVNVYEVEPNYTPKRLLKVKLFHNNRKILIFKMTDENNSSNGTSFFCASGAHPMQGINNDPIEMVLDFSNHNVYWTNNQAYAKEINIKVFEKDTDTLGLCDGELLECKFIDNDGVRRELPALLTPIPIDSCGATDLLTIDYFYIPSVFDYSYYFPYHDTIKITKNVKFTNGSTLKFRINTVIFENGYSLTIDEESKCEIQGNTNFVCQNDISNIHIGGELIVTQGVQLDITPNINLEGNGSTGKVIVEGTLRLSNQQLSNLKVEVKDGGKLIITDHVSMQNNTSLVLRSGAMVEGDVNANTLNLSYTQCTIESEVTFKNLTHNGVGGVFLEHSQPLTLDQIQVINTNFKVKPIYTNIYVENCTFNGSTLDLQHKYGRYGNATINNCTFKNTIVSQTGMQEVLRINIFSSFEVTNNVFTNNRGTAIAIYNSGDENSLIARNKISHNYYGSASSGILIYASKTSICNNVIHNNDYGISLYHNSNVSIAGDVNSIDNEVYQLIYRNTRNQIFVGNNSFPWKFEYNVITENSNPYPRFYMTSTPFTPFNIAHNCWGTNFEPENDLHPFNIFIYEPVWDCGFNPGPIEDELRSVYERSVSLMDGNPEGAMVEFKTIVDTWPQSGFAARQ